MAIGSEGHSVGDRDVRVWCRTFGIVRIVKSKLFNAFIVKSAYVSGAMTFGPSSLLPTVDNLSLASIPATKFRRLEIL